MTGFRDYARNDESWNGHVILRGAKRSRRIHFLAKCCPACHVALRSPISSAGNDDAVRLVLKKTEKLPLFPVLMHWLSCIIAIIQSDCHGTERQPS